MSSAAPPDLIVDALTLRYQDTLLFDDFNCRFRGNRINCLLGPSGSGKSTLLRLIAGLPLHADNQPPDRVIRTDDGRSLAGQITWMAQQDSLLPWCNVEDNVILGAKLRGETPDRDRARTILQRLDLDGYGPRQIQTLSGGMRQRIALARSLMENRPIMLMDEPFAAVDALTRMKLQDYAASILADHTVILVTHDPYEALRLGESIFILKRRPAELVTLMPPASPIPRPSYDPEMASSLKAILTHLDPS